MDVELEPPLRANPKMVDSGDLSSGRSQSLPTMGRSSILWDGKELYTAASSAVTERSLGCSYLFSTTHLNRLRSPPHRRSTNRGEVGFIGANNDALSIIVSDGVKTRIVRDTRGPFADFPQDLIRTGISLNNRGDVAFMIALDNGDIGIFTGADVVRDKVIAAGDPLAGSSVAGGIILSRQSLKNNGQIAFQATLADGRIVGRRAEPRD